MPNVGKYYPNEIGKLKRIKSLFGWSNSDINNISNDFCKTHIEYSPPSQRTIDKVYAEGSEQVTFTYSTIKTLLAMSSYHEQQAGYNPEDSEIIYEQAELLRLIVSQKNARISELEKIASESELKVSQQAEKIFDLEAENADLKTRKEFFKTEYERAMRIVESLTSK